MKIYKDYDKYKSIDELADDLNTGMEIEFRYNGKDYLLCWTSETMLNLSRANIGGDDGVEFSSIDDMFKHEVDGLPLRDIVTEIQVTAHFNKFEI